jgi:hypothetical protein
MYAALTILLYVSSAAAAAVWDLVLVPTTGGAVSLDGGPASYYIIRGAETNKWIIHQNGGGWCSSPISCAQRSNTTLGSSRFFPPTTPDGNYTFVDDEGNLSSDETANPLFYNWTRVSLMYTDGSSQTSDVDAPVVVEGWPVPIYYRGARVLKATIASLLSAGLASATDVVISGCSAGGLSTYLHADRWAASVPGARVAALADSGFFLDFNATGSSLTYPQRMQWTYENANISGMLYPQCLAQWPVSEGWRCFMAQYVAPFIQTPLFMIQSYHDSYQVGAIAQVLPNNTAGVNAYGSVLADTIAVAQAANPKLGGAIDACYHHCSRTLWEDMFFAAKGGSNVSEGGAFLAWWATRGESGQRVWKQDSAYPCTTCCTTDSAMAAEREAKCAAQRLEAPDS